MVNISEISMKDVMDVHEDPGGEVGFTIIGILCTALLFTESGLGPKTPEFEESGTIFTYRLLITIHLLR